MSPTLREPCEIIVNKILSGRPLTPFLGAGVNLCERGEDSPWRSSVSPFYPSGRELATHLAATSTYPGEQPEELTRVSQFIVITEGIGDLYDRLRGVFNRAYTPTRAHTFFASLPSRLRRSGRAPSLVIVTTNYDDLLERAFKKAGEAYDLLSYVSIGPDGGRFRHYRYSEGEAEPEGVIITEPNTRLDISPEERTVILKVHGHVEADPDHDSFVITEDDFIEYLCREKLEKAVPVNVARSIRGPFLFLGYRLQDWNLRAMLHRIARDQPRHFNSWAIQAHVDELDRLFWLHRKVQILSVRLNEFIDTLDQRLSEALEEPPLGV
jgi:hypothetical protein